MSGRRAEVNPKLPPLAAALKRALDTSKNGELFTTQQLARLTGHNVGILRQNAYLLPGYWHNIRVSLKYWGKPATIDELRKELKKR